MADVSQLEVNGTTYNICDATARDSLSHVLELVYPVGSVYINASDSTNPATLLGFGTWERVGTGRVMIDANSTYAAGSTGGSATHTHTTGDCTLTAAQSGLKAHNHGTTITQPVFKYTAPKSHTHNLSSSGYAYISISATGAGYVTNWQVSAASKTYAAKAIKATEGYTEKSISHSSGTGLGGKTDSASAADTTNGATASRTTDVAVTVNDNTAADASAAHNHGNTGDGSTIQPWVGVYMWKRTA